MSQGTKPVPRPAEAVGATLDVVEKLMDAIDHIRRTVLSSRTQTRRLRWIATRCEYALEGRVWDGPDVPVNDPLLEALRAMIVRLQPIIERELAALLDEFADKDGNIDANAEPDLVEELATMRWFLDECARNVPEFFQRGPDDERKH